MIIRLIHSNREYAANLSAPIDISIPLQNGISNPNCFFAPPPVFEPVRAGGFVGSTAEGGAVNFFNIQLNPHGNGTHTECAGHIAKEIYTINRCLSRFHSIGRLITVQPQQRGDDRVITREVLEQPLSTTDGLLTTLIIRTLPNNDTKKNQQYSNTNPPYIDAGAMQWIVSAGVEHLVVDLPSVDREVDGGLLDAHHIFWNYPGAPRLQATITELVYVPETVPNGLYLVNHQIMSIELDASPSKILLFALEPA